MLKGEFFGVKIHFTVNGTQCAFETYSSAVIVGNTEYTEWQQPLSGLHSIMMEKSAQADEVGGARAHPLLLYLPSRTKFVVYALAERGRYTLHISALPLYVLGGWELFNVL